MSNVLKPADEVQLHRFVNLFPSMEDEQWWELVNSVKVNGVLTPVLMFQNQLVDGRHRREAAQLAGVDCPFVEWSGSEEALLEHVIALNHLRRHLTQSQLGVVALAVEKEREVFARQRRVSTQIIDGQPPVSAARRQPQDSPETQVSAHGSTPGRQTYKPSGKATAEAAQQLGVGARTVERVKYVASKAPELLEDIKAGKMTATEAERKARQTYKPAAQSAPAKKGGHGVDRYGREILSKRQAGILAAADDFARLQRSISEIKGAIRKLATTEAGKDINLQQLEADLSNAHRALRFAAPHCLCIYCGGSGRSARDNDCEACKGFGIIGEGLYSNAPAKLKAADQATTTSKAA